LVALHVLDSFYIMLNGTIALDEVRRAEVTQLCRDGYESILTKARWCLLKRPVNLTKHHEVRLEEILQNNLKSIGTQLLREEFERFSVYIRPKWAAKFLDAWCTRTKRSRIVPMKKIARSLRRHRHRICPKRQKDGQRRATVMKKNHPWGNSTGSPLCNSVSIFLWKDLMFHASGSLRWFACIASLLFPPAMPAGWAHDLVGLYITWPDDPTTGAVINWVNLYPRHAVTIWYRDEDAKEWSSAEAEHSQIEPSSLQLRRVELTGLAPDRTYVFGIGSKPGPGEGWRFRTMPARLQRVVRFVAGGDMLHDRAALDRMNMLAAKLEPDFALLGGDLAYDNGVTATSWIDWLGSWLKAGLGRHRRLIPLVTVIGNHEVRGGNNARQVEDSTYFSTLLRRPGERSFCAIDVGDYLSLIVLDSGHTQPVAGLQAEWLAAALEDRRDQRFLFASYHFPAYGTAKAPPDKLPIDHPKSIAIREHWLPHLERYGVTAVFEHDHHNFKRSHRIRAGARDDERGLLFLGDGAWGVPTRHVPSPEQAWWLARAEPRNHLWCLDLELDGTAVARAIDAGGEVFDEVRIGESRTRPTEVSAEKAE